MRVLLAAALVLCPIQSFAKCHTFTDGERIFDFEFHDNVNIYAENCRVNCDEGQCTFECASPPYVATVFDSNPPVAMDLHTGKMTPLEPLCEGTFISPPPKYRLKRPNDYRFKVWHVGIGIE
jgi:hypothetical protein